MDLYARKCEGAKKQGVCVGLVSGAGYGLSFFALYCFYAICFFAGSYYIQTGEATFKEFFNVRAFSVRFGFVWFRLLMYDSELLMFFFWQVFFALTITAVGVSNTSALAPDMTKAQDSATSILDILDRKPKIDSSSDEGTMLAIVKGDIEFKHVAFRYPTRPDIQIFRDLCLTIPSGKVNIKLNTWNRAI